MDASLVVEACAYLCMERVNVELLFDDGPQGTIYYGVRLRPWANSERKSDMILGVGETLSEAFEQACIKHVANEWEEMDWRARPARAIARKELEKSRPNLFKRPALLSDHRKPDKEDFDIPIEPPKRNR